MKQARVDGDNIIIKFFVKSEFFQQTIAQIKSIPRRQYHPDTKSWSCPVTQANILLLKSFGFDLDETAISLLEPRKAVERPPELQAPIDESLLPKGLRHYQIEALRFLEAVHGRGMLTMAPRLGKSIVSLCYTVLHPEASPTLIVCPASVKIGWQREIKKWLGKESHIISGTTPYSIPKQEFYIINYDILYDWKDSLPPFKYLITDESHRISNLSNPAKNAEGKYVQKPVKCTQAFLQLANGTPYVVCLTGTPITSRVPQLFVPLSVYDPDHFTNYYAFCHRYGDPTHNGYTWVFNGLSHEDELIPLLSKIMFRRKREDVFTDLPEETHEFVPVEIDRAEYEKELASFRKWLEKHPSTPEQIEEKVSQFESLSYSKKRGAIIEWLKEFLELGEKIVVFTHHRSVSEDLHSVFKKHSVLMYGGTSMKDRQKSIDTFNTDPDCLMFIGNVDACKEGISLYGANIVAYVEVPLVVGALVQSQRRIWLPEKSTQKASYLYFIAEDTVDEKRVKNLIKRSEVMDTVLDGKVTSLFGDLDIVSGI